MNKNDLINQLTRTLGSKREAKQALENIFSAMREALCSNEKVIISGFGSFNVKFYRAKKIVNPRTKKLMLIPPKRKIKFKPSKHLLT